MASQEDYRAVHERRFLDSISRRREPVWGFSVYATYIDQNSSSESRPEATSKDQAPAADLSSFVPDARFQALLDKVRGYATAYIAYSKFIPAPYDQQIIDKCQLKPAAWLPGASLSDVRAHFRSHIGDTTDPAFSDELFGPMYEWCLVIDDEAAATIEAGPERFMKVPRGETYGSMFAPQKKVIVKALEVTYNEQRHPQVLGAKGRGPKYELLWEGWIRLRPVALLQLFRDADQNLVKSEFQGVDEVYDLA